MAVDEDLVFCQSLQWARVPVKTDSRKEPSMLHMVVGLLCYAIQLWWEIPNFVEQIVSRAWIQRVGG